MHTQTLLNPQVIMMDTRSKLKPENGLQTFELALAFKMKSRNRYKVQKPIPGV